MEAEALSWTWSSIKEYFIYFFTHLTEKNELSDYNLLISIPLFIIITIGRIVLERLFYRLGVILINFNKKNFKHENPVDYNTKLIKFREQAFKCFYHGFVGILAFVLFYRESWWWDSRDAYSAYGYVYLHSPLHVMYYMIQMSFHLHSLIYHYIERINHVRDDDIQMQVHHFATIILILGSYCIGQLRMGTLVLYVHDCSDVSTALTKLANYSKSHVSIIAILLVNLIFSWAYYRLYQFPKTTILIATELFGLPNGGYWILFLIFLTIILELLHWIWFYQILHIPMAIVKNRKEFDPTEDWKGATTNGKKVDEDQVENAKPSHKKKE